MTIKRGSHKCLVSLKFNLSISNSTARLRFLHSLTLIARDLKIQYGSLYGNTVSKAKKDLSQSYVILPITKQASIVCFFGRPPFFLFSPYRKSLCHMYCRSLSLFDVGIIIIFSECGRKPSDMGKKYTLQGCFVSLPHDKKAMTHAHM